ncbi:hypothetical protein BDZ45DRAFT_124899 [Acephala macrosclerotiorum]|nr:hypothetical protein BDZ45DRAFT_124899 [Acephala macrosclerotiorum]
MNFSNTFAASYSLCLFLLDVCQSSLQLEWRKSSQHIIRGEGRNGRFLTRCVGQGTCTIPYPLCVDADIPYSDRDGSGFITIHQIYPSRLLCMPFLTLHSSSHGLRAIGARLFGRMDIRISTYWYQGRLHGFCRRGIKKLDVGMRGKEVLESGGTTNLYVWLWNGLGLALALTCDRLKGVE